MSAQEDWLSSRVTPIRSPTDRAGTTGSIDWALEPLAGEGATFLIVVEPTGWRVISQSGIAAREAGVVIASCCENGGRIPEGQSTSRAENMRPGEGAILRIHDCGRSGIEMLIGTQPDLAAFELDRLEMLGCALAPALGRCLALGVMVESERCRADSLLDLLGRERAGLIILDSARQLCFVNRSARRLLSANDGIKNVRGTVTGSTIAAALRLQAALDHVEGSADVGHEDGPPAIMLMLDRGRGKRPLTAAVTALAGGRRPGEPALAIHIIPHDEEIAKPIASVCTLYRLSPAEGRLAQHLVMGLSLLEIAREMGVKHETVRTYLRQVFNKTGTNRQADLVRLLVTSLPPVDLRKVEAVL